MNSAAGGSHMTIQWLKDQGFEGFTRFDEITKERVPVKHGAYAVVRGST